MTEPAPPPLAFRVLNEIGILAQLANAQFNAVMPHGLTVAQFTILNHFVRLGGERSLVELARAFQVSKPTMGDLVQKLAGKGFVSVGPDAADRRTKRVAITAAGRAAQAEAIATLGPYLQELAGAVGEARLAALLPELVALRQWLDQRRNTIRA